MRKGLGREASNADLTSAKLNIIQSIQKQHKSA